MERLARMARAEVGAAVSPPRVRRSPVPGEVVAASRRCVEDARAAIHAVAAERTVLLGFSMGGAVAISAAGEASVEGVLGLAPWIPDRLSLEPLRGKRLDVLHGSLDRWLPGVPGVSPASSRRDSSARMRWASRASTG